MTASKIIARIVPAPEGRIIRTPHGVTLELTARDLARALATPPPDPPPDETP